MQSSDFSESEANIPNREELLQMAIRTAKAGNRDAARMMFRQVLDDDRRNERAMMWLARLSSNKAERKQWLNRVLIVNPDNDIARDNLRRMEYKSRAKNNQVLLVFGVIAAVLIILGLVIFLALPLLSGGR